MRVKNNPILVKILNHKSKNNCRLGKSLKKLSMGLRITGAADDAAGLSISEKMKAQIRSLNRASKNAQDAHSFLMTRDGVLDETHHLLQRMRELNIQSLNATLTDEDRKKIQKEFRALQIAISELAAKSEFNTIPLFDAHEVSFYAFEGNQKFTDLVKIVDGLNNDLLISVDGEITEVFVAEGAYTIAEIADLIDSELFDKNPDLIINLTGDNTLSLQAENNLSIDFIKGGLSFLFYEYCMGTPPGLIIGVTEFQENGRLNIIPGHNDRLNFYVGSDKEYSICFEL
ncbi:MAG: hypothetical protein GX996_03755 [Firmicutes bacterium]|nr:hypothetical protein [Bacillota bacterium]